jgi:hypothetical protein
MEGRPTDGFQGVSWWLSSNLGQQHPPGIPPPGPQELQWVYTFFLGRVQLISCPVVGRMTPTLGHLVKNLDLLTPHQQGHEPHPKVTALTSA